MADPLSVTASILAIVGAADKALNGLDRVWQLRYRDQQFLDLQNQSTGIRMQTRAIHLCLPAIERCEANTELFADTLRDIKTQSVQATALLGNLDRALQEMTRKSRGNHRSIMIKPSKITWLKRQSETTRLMSQVNTVIQPLTATLTLLQTHIHTILPRHMATFSSSNFAIQSIAIQDRRCDNDQSYSADDTSIESQLEQAVQTLQDVSLNENPTLSSSSSNAESFDPDDGMLIRNTPTKSPAASFHTAHSHRSSMKNQLLTFTGTLAAESCKRFCPCQCHVPRQVQTPMWAREFLGSISFAGNASPLLNRRPCNKPFCGRSGAVSMQFTYVAPAWSFLKSFIVQGNAQSVRGWNSSWSVRVPRVIGDRYNIWRWVSYGRMSKVKEALAKGWASPFDVDKNGQSLVHYAALNRQFDVYRFLLSQGGQSNIPDGGGITPTHYLIHNFISGKPSDLETDLVNQDQLDEQGFTLLHRIVTGLHGMDLFTYLTEVPSDIDTTDASGRTPLFWAAYRGEWKAVDLLLNAGAAVDKSDISGVTPLMQAANEGTYAHAHCIQRLLSAGASSAAVDRHGWSAIHWGCDSRPASSHIMRELIEHGAEVNWNTKDGMNTLHLAAQFGTTDTIDFLLSCGVDIDSTTNDGRTPAAYALQCNAWENFYHLARLGADIGRSRDDGVTLLHSAVWHSPIHIWEYLKEQAELGRLAAINGYAVHDGHNIWICFDHCRNSLYDGVRDINEEEKLLQALLEAVLESQSGSSSEV